MKDLLNNGFQTVSETELVMVEGGESRNTSSSFDGHADGLPIGGGDVPDKPIVPPSGMDLPDPHAGEK